MMQTNAFEHEYALFSQRDLSSYLFSDSPLRVGVEVALLGLPRGFLAVESSRPSVLCLLGVL